MKQDLQAVKVSQATFETTKQLPSLQTTATLYLVDGQEVMILEAAEDSSWKVFTPALDQNDCAADKQSRLESRYTLTEIVEACEEVAQGVVVDL
jgi:hypothetical protein